MPKLWVAALREVAARGATSGFVAAVVLAALTGCASGVVKEQQASDAGGTTIPFETAGADDAVPTPPTRAPLLGDTQEDDRDQDGVDDRLERSGGLASGVQQQQEQQLDGDVEVEVVLNRPLTRAHLGAWRSLGGSVRYVFRAVSYGFTGTIPRRAIPKVAATLRPALRLLAAPVVGVPCLDEATRTGRVRGVWATDFARGAGGFSGSSDITIAIVDTGVDVSHPDLSGRMVGWKDYTTDGIATAHDVAGHGTHVASIAAGTGVAFGTPTGTGTLHYTQYGDLSGITTGNFVPSPVHSPSYLTGTGAPLSVSSVATFPGGSTTSLHADYAPDLGTWSRFGTASGMSALSLPLAATSAASAHRYTGALLATAGVSTYAVANTIDRYPAVGDGFNALRGVASSCNWFGAKVFRDDNSSGSSTDFGAAVDDLVVRRVADKIKIVNMSLTLLAPSTTFRAKVNTAVENGVLVVVAAGNDGPSTELSDPARAGRVLTIGATNDVNELTSYTSIGFGAPLASEDTKPDLLAPGGSPYRSGILAADSNTADAKWSSFADVSPDDYTNLWGTSMASPMAAGSAALVIQALEQKGHVWDFASAADPLLVKMLLLATATETVAGRENGSTNSPPLGRAAAPKDLYEGYGIMNPDAAVEAVMLPFASPVSDAPADSRPEWQQRAWARSIILDDGAIVALNLAVPPTADYDLYLYGGQGDANGNPVLRASSTRASAGAQEWIWFTSKKAETAYLVVKRVTGTGTFSLSGTVTLRCGNGTIDPGETCDPGIVGSAGCCVACHEVTNGAACDDGNACTATDRCKAGICVGEAPVVCAPADECHAAGTCEPITGVCSAPPASDGTVCSDGMCQAGSCVTSRVLRASGGCECALAAPAERGGHAALPALASCLGLAWRRRRRARACRERPGGPRPS